MDQLAGPLALVSYHRRLRVERGQLAQTEPAQDRADRGNRHAQLSRNGRSAHPLPPQAVDLANPFGADAVRSEEHTSELQSHVNLVCRLLLEKKKTNRPP